MQKLVPIDTEGISRLIKENEQELKTIPEVDLELDLT